MDGKKMKDEFKEMNSQLKQVPIEEILELQQSEIEEKQRKEKIRMQILHEKGIYLNSADLNQETDL